VVATAERANQSGDGGGTEPKRRGRKPLTDEQRRERVERLRDTGSGNGIGDSERERTGEQSGSGSAGEAGAETLFGPESVTVEPPKAEPKRTTRRGRKSTKITGHQVELLTVQAFTLIAIVRQNDVWFVRDPASEIGPWSEQAAELLNEIPKEYIDAFSRGSAGIAVAFGLGSMVFTRVMEERAQQMALRMEAARQRAPEMQRQEQSTEPAREQAATVAGTGASPRHPGHIPGLQDNGSPFAR